jgi:long-chain fatty acid transport protein
MRHSKLALVLLGAFTLLASPALATNGHQLAAIGPYQAGMGGATTAAPFDTTTIIANPAGIALINPRADMNAEAFMPVRTVDFTATGGGTDQGGSPLYLIPSVGMASGIDGTDMAFGAGIFLTSGMGVDYSTTDSVPFGAQGGNFTPWKANIYSQYQLWKVAPAIAKKINDSLTVGAALNVDYQQMALKMKFSDPGSANYMGADLSRASGAMGFGFSLGAIYKVNDMFQFGATYTSEQSFSDIEYRLSSGDVMYPNGWGKEMLVSGNDTYKLKMNFPQQAALGVAITPMEGLKITADYKWINFSSTMDKINLKGDFTLISQTTGKPVGATTSLPIATGWDDVNVIAVGVEYKVAEGATLRAGYNHSDSPIKAEDVFSNLALPAIAQDHIGLGADVKLGSNWELDLAYLKALKNTVTGSGDMLGQSSKAQIALEGSSLTLGVAYNFGK